MYPEALGKWGRVVAFEQLDDLVLRRRKVAPVRTKKPYFIVDSPFEVRVRSAAGAFWHIVVPSGFVTDGASVPRAFWNVVAPTGPHLEASVVHDWLYSGWQVRDVVPMEERRRWADDVFLAGLEAAGVGLLKRYTMWAAVRGFGKEIYFGRDELILL